MRGTVHDAGIRRRWRLLDQAGELMGDKVPRVDRDGRQVVHYRYRVAMCQRGLSGGGADIMRSLDGQRAEFAGVQTCGSPFSCPVCSAKIAARQVQQMNLAMKRHKEAGGAVYLVTLTNQHDRESAGQGRCKAAWDQLAAALSNAKGRRPWLAFREAHNVLGSIRGIESTYGELNGFHHHTHEIVFADAGLLVLNDKGEPVRWKSPLYKLRRVWARVLIKKGLAGLRPGDIGAEKFRKLRNLLTRCFDARDGQYATEYLLKFGKEPESWGLASELAKAQLKGGQGRPDNPRRCDHAGPWELLNDALDGDKRSGELWREWSIAMHGRAKLYWSPGLKARFDIPDISEIEMARAPDSRCVEKVVSLGLWEWRLVLSRGARFDVLRVAALEGEAGVIKLLRELVNRPPTNKGDFYVQNYTPPPALADALRLSVQRDEKTWGR